MCRCVCFVLRVSDGLTGKDMNTMFDSDRLGYLEQLERAERTMRSWDTTVAGSTQTFSALVNVAARREADRGTDGPAGASGDDVLAERALTAQHRPHGRALENAAKLEAYAQGLRRVLAVLRGLADDLAAASDAALALYGRAVRAAQAGAADAEALAEARARVRDEGVRREARAASVLDAVEALQAAAGAYEREYWVKRRVVERALDYSRPQEMDALLQAWAEDTQVARDELRSALRRAKGCAMRLSVD